MIQRFLAVFTSFLFTCSLYADPFLMRISADSDPHSSVAGCINVFSGEFFWTENDIESKRAGGLNYSRVYDSGCLRPNVMGYGWGNNFAKDLIHFESNSKTTGSVLLGSCEYDPFPFAVQEQQKGSFAGKVHEGIFSLGYTISPEALAMGVPSFSRTKVFSENSKKWWKTKLPDGTLRTYERIEDEQKLKTGSLYRYRLAEEKLPNEHIRHYTYFPDSASLTKISVTNKDGSRELDSLSFTYGNKKNGYEREICSASGVKVYYKGVLSFVGYPLCPALVFDLNKTSGAHIEGSSYRTSYFHGPLGDDLKIDQIIRADSTIHVDYYDDIKKDSYGKAKALKVSWGGALNSIYTFKYLKNQTEVRDCFDNKTTYTRSNHRLEKITQGKYREFTYCWNSKGHLLNKALQTIDGKVLRKTSFTYDVHGNLNKPSSEISQEMTTLGSPFTNSSIPKI